MSDRFTLKRTYFPLGATYAGTGLIDSYPRVLGSNVTSPIPGEIYLPSPIPFLHFTL